MWVIMSEVETTNNNMDVSTSELQCIKLLFCKEQSHDKNTQTKLLSLSWPWKVMRLCWLKRRMLQ